MKPRTKRIETIQAVLIAIFAALILRQFVIAAYKIPTSSMENTLLVGDFLLVNKFVYGAKSPDWVGVPFTRNSQWGIPLGLKLPEAWQFRLPSVMQPQPKDILVFKYPRNPKLEYIKRCIAIGEQMVRIRNKMVFVNGKPFDEPPEKKNEDPVVYRRDQNFGYTQYSQDWGSRDNFGPIRVKKDHYFVMGDNRDNSSDSRSWGFVPPDNIVGKPLIIYLSMKPGDSGFNILKNIRWKRLGNVVR